MRFLFFILLLVIGNNLFGQSFSINTDGASAAVSAMLDVKSSTKGLLIPRMTKTEKNSIVSPAIGLLIFQNGPDSTGFYYYNGAAWLWLANTIQQDTMSWRRKGNAGTDTAMNFIGTTDNMPLRFKQNNVAVGNWNLNNGNFYIGKDAGAAITSGTDNSYFGSSSNSTIVNITNSTAIGAKSQVDTSNALVLGSIAGINSAAANTNVAIGTTKPKATLHLSRGSSGSVATIPSSRTLLIEDNTASYIQLLHPSANESGILAGSEVALIKSGVIFSADSAVLIRTGGNNSRIFITKTGFTGINNATPQARLHVNSSALVNANYISAATGIFESGNTVSDGFLQLMNPSTRSFRIGSGTEQTFYRSGISFQADSSITFETGGILSRMQIDKAGVLNVFNKIGINNSTPQARLHITSMSLTNANYINGATAVFENGSIGLDSYLQLMNSSTRNFRIASGTDETFYRSGISFQADSSLSFETGGIVSRMQLDKAGVLNVANRVGINNTAPQARLHVNSISLANANYINGATAVFENGSIGLDAYLQLINSSSRAFRIGSGTELAFIRSGISFEPDSSLSFETGGLIERMTILKNGSVGINTIAPTATIDVAGSFKMGVSGTINNAIIKVNVSVNVGIVAPDSFLDTDITVANAATTGAVFISPTTELPNGITIVSARVPLINTVRLRVWNQTAAPIDPPIINYNIGIVQ